MTTIISAAIALLSSFFKGDGVSKVAGSGNGLVFYGALASGVYWFFNGAESWSVTLNGQGLIGAIVGGSMLLEWFRNMRPPSP